MFMAKQPDQQAKLWLIQKNTELTAEVSLLRKEEAALNERIEDLEEAMDEMHNLASLMKETFWNNMPQDRRPPYDAVPRWSKVS